MCLSNYLEFLLLKFPFENPGYPHSNPISRKVIKSLDDEDAKTEEGEKIKFRLVGKMIIAIIKFFFMFFKKSCLKCSTFSFWNMKQMLIIISFNIQVAILLLIFCVLLFESSFYGFLCTYYTDSCCLTFFLLRFQFW